jgi:multidrug efflux pump subunit AcrB
METLKDFLLALALAIVAIYILLVILFDSYMQPFLIMFIIPYALIGVLITLMMHGMPMSFIAMVGLLGLIGVVVNDTIVMTNRLNEMCALKGKSIASIADGAASRFRPVILTTVTTVVALVPTAYGIGGKLHFIRPMILVVAWGLAFATIISLVLAPTLYAFMYRVRK